MTGNLPLGKLPPHLLGSILADAPLDESVVVGPGIGLDCAVVESGGRLLVMKTDPITFSSDQIGWYVVQINANDIATTGASPRWFMANLLLPESRTGESLAGVLVVLSRRRFQSAGRLLVLRQRPEVGRGNSLQGRHQLHVRHPRQWLAEPVPRGCGPVR